VIREVEREIAFILKQWELKLRSFNGRKEKTMNAVHSLARFMASPSISHFHEIQ